MSAAGDGIAASVENLTLNDALLEQLECPVCFETMRAPIFMCRNGHNVCAGCRGRVQECPVCREPGSPANRNLAFEALCSQALVPCRNATSGCAVELRAKQLDKHHAECDFRFQCLCCECAWQGDRKGLNDHVFTKHPDFYRSSSSPRRYTWGFDPTRSLGVLIFAPWEGELFWVRLRYNAAGGELYLYAQCLGTTATARRFRCEFRLASPDRRFAAVYAAPALTLDEDYTCGTLAPRVDKYMLKLLTHVSDEFEYSYSIHKISEP